MTLHRGVITATGEMMASAGIHERTTLTAAVTPVADRWTLMLAWGITRRYA